MRNKRVRRWLPLCLLLAIALTSLGGSFTCFASSGDSPPPPPPPPPAQPGSQ